MSSASKAYFICGISGNKGFSKYGNQSFNSEQTHPYLPAIESSRHSKIHVHVLCLCMNVAHMNSHPRNTHEHDLANVLYKCNKRQI